MHDIDIVSIFFGGIFGIICIYFCCKKYIEDRQIIGITRNTNYIMPRLTHTPYKMVENVDSDKECIICMDKIDGRECRLNCGHGYHYNCIKEWAYDRQNNSCPQCRDTIIEYVI
jgi:hypothetical protein